MSTAALAPPEAASAAKVKRPPRISARTFLTVGGAILLIAAGAVYIASPKSTASTDDAYLHADSTVVAPKVRGLVSAILVVDNQTVKAGDPLVRIDNDLAVVWAPFEFRIDGKLDHCGTDLFSLVHNNGKWLIGSLAATLRKDCGTK